MARFIGDLESVGIIVHSVDAEGEAQ
jgi:hypothetical protein